MYIVFHYLAIYVATYVAMNRILPIATKLLEFNFYDKHDNLKLDTT